MWNSSYIATLGKHERILAFRGYYRYPALGGLAAPWEQDFLFRKADEMSPFDEDPADNLSELDLCIEEIKQLQTKPEQCRWIPVSERLPELPHNTWKKCSKVVWLIYQNKPQMGYYTKDAGWWIYGIRFQKRINQKDITYWQDIILPEALR